MEIYIGYKFDLEKAQGKITSIRQERGQTTIYVMNTGVNQKYRDALRSFFGKVVNMGITGNLTWITLNTKDLTCTINKKLNQLV